MHHWSYAAPGCCCPGCSLVRSHCIKVCPGVVGTSHQVRGVYLEAGTAGAVLTRSPLETHRGTHWDLCQGSYGKQPGRKELQCPFGKRATDVDGGFIAAYLQLMSWRQKCCSISRNFWYLLTVGDVCQERRRMRSAHHRQTLGNGTWTQDLAKVGSHTVTYRSWAR